MENVPNKRKSLKVVDNIMLDKATPSDEVCQKKRRLNAPSSAKKKRKSSFSVFEDKTAIQKVKEFAEKATNTEETIGIESQTIEKDLCSEGEPSNGYWKELAEARREALDNTLKENEQLHGKVDELNAKVKELEEQQSNYEELAERAEQLANAVQYFTEEADSHSPDELPDGSSTQTTPRNV